MKFSHSVCAVAALAASVTAFPSLAQRDATLEPRQDPAGHPWQIVQAGGVRAPCPGLNTLANHGYINRNGRCISKQQMQQGFLDAFNMAFDGTSPGGDNALALCGRNRGQSGPCTCFDLSDMDTPHAIEHDASLTRRDKQMFHDQNADNVAFNQTIWNRSLMIYGNARNVGLKFANTARIKRVQQAQGADFPGWFSENVGGSLAEHSFILSTMNDPSMNVNLNTPGANPLARMDWINYWFTHQRLPTALGWRRPSQTISGANLGSIAAAVSNAPTVSVYPGDSPYLQPNRKRSIDGPSAPVVSYTFDERDIDEFGGIVAEKRDVVPLAAVPTLISDVPTKVISAQAQASALAGEPPAAPNPYFDVLTMEEWDAYSAALAAYKAKFNTFLTQILAATTTPP